MSTDSTDQATIGTAPVPVLVIGGYLGAGKTTLINRLLRDADRSITVLVNDFGPVNIDAALVASVHGDTVELTNGCVCCSVGDDLTEAMLAISVRPQKPDLVIIETSGVADPRAAAAYAHVPGFSSAGTVVVVDGSDFGRQASDRFIGRTVRQQAAAADLLLVSKSDLDPGGPVRSVCAGAAPGVPVVDSGDFGLDMLPLSRVTGLHSPQGHEGVHASRIEHPELAVPQDAVRWLESLGPSVARAKGVVSMPSGNFLVELAGSRASVTPTTAEESNGIVIIDVPTGPGQTSAE